MLVDNGVFFAQLGIPAQTTPSLGASEAPGFLFLCDQAPLPDLLQPLDSTGREASKRLPFQRGSKPGRFPFFFFFFFFFVFFFFRPRPWSRCGFSVGVQPHRPRLADAFLRLLNRSGHFSFPLSDRATPPPWDRLGRAGQSLPALAAEGVRNMRAACRRFPLPPVSPGR